MTPAPIFLGLAAVSLGAGFALIGHLDAFSPAPRYPFCAPGYSESVRPPEAVSAAVKREMVSRQYPGEPVSAFELDHIWSIGTGGPAWDMRNLQLQRWPDARRKDALEWRLHDLVCAGKVSVAAARKLQEDWKP